MGERCVFFGKTMATAISKGTAVHSEAVGKGKEKGLGCLNASHALEAAAPGPAALHGRLCPQSLLPTSARARWASLTVLAWCRGIQHTQQSNRRPIQFACRVATPPSMHPLARAGRGARCEGWPGPPAMESWDVPACPGQIHQGNPQWRAQGQSVSDLKFEQL